ESEQATARTGSRRGHDHLRAGRGARLWRRDALERTAAVLRIFRRSAADRAGLGYQGARVAARAAGKYNAGPPPVRPDALGVGAATGGSERAAGDRDVLDFRRRGCHRVAEVLQALGSRSAGTARAAADHRRATGCAPAPTESAGAPSPADAGPRIFAGR